MARNCPKCGTENPDDRIVCIACGYTRASRVTLTAVATGKSIEMTLDTAVGKQCIRPLSDPDFVYASEPQFHIIRDLTTGQWAILPDGAAKNPTHLDGRLLDAQAPLHDGVLLTLGSSRLKLKVSIQFI